MLKLLVGEKYFALPIKSEKQKLAEVWYQDLLKIFLKTLLSILKISCIFIKYLISEIKSCHQTNNSSRSEILTTESIRSNVGDAFGSDTSSTLSQEPSGPFSPLGERVGARIEGRCLGIGNRVRENSFSRFFSLGIFGHSLFAVGMIFG